MQSESRVDAIHCCPLLLIGAYTHSRSGFGPILAQGRVISRQAAIGRKNASRKVTRFLI